MKHTPQEIANFWERVIRVEYCEDSERLEAYMDIDGDNVCEFFIPIMLVDFHNCKHGDNFFSQVECPECFGDGIAYETGDSCPWCHGTGKIDREEV
ncbi:MAG: hypothetical protein EOM12_11810 [Verrucomicrobiae bacterium]|nr:hypothetical protein [Verrucomicrobiae bacterium]